MHYYRLMAESLSTHVQLDIEDVEWGARAFEDMESLLSFQKKLILCLLANRKTVTGRYARLFNLSLRDVIEKRSFERFERLCLLRLRELFPELYNNNLADDQIEVVERIINREFRTFETSFNNSQDNIVPYVRSRLPENLRGHGYKSYENAHRWVTVRTLVPRSPYIVDKIRVMDQDGRIHTYSRSEIVRRLAARVYLDPYTGHPFDPYVLDQMMERFDLEIKLLQYDVTA